ncbi:RsiV family protein [Fusobacterium sp. IOR10]|uniref:RsiV family protein n=1 Tax=Fusobacterium sp. IOR10 TaxID=2665157 RepID=UPI00351A0472
MTEEGKADIENKILESIEKDFKKSNNDETKVFYFQDSLESDAVKLKNANVYFNGDKLIVTYPHYTLAPYSTGMPEFIFSKEEMKKYLKDLT